jgi:intracellular sulfur oxidation DsrE/DsrF family protein
MKSRLLIAMAVVLALFVSTHSAAEMKGYDKQKVVYHVNYDDAKAQAGALRNIQNHINAVGAENLDLKVVLHGNGLAMLLVPDAAGRTKFSAGNATDEIQTKIMGLKNQGVGFQVCANTLKGKKVSYKEDLFDVEDADIVPSGVAELAKLQAIGYTYIKP